MAGNWMSDAFGNPKFRQFLSEAGQDLGYGLAQSPTIGGAFGVAAQRGQDLQPQRDLASKQKAEEAKRLSDINHTAAFLREKGEEGLATAVENGMTTGTDAFNTWYKKTNPGPGEAFTLGAGDVRYDANGNVLAEGGQAKPTSSMQEYQFAQQQGYGGSFQEYETEMKKAGATSIDFNQNQGVAAGFADRMAAADAILADPKLTAAQTDLVQQGVAGAPFGNFLTSEDKKLADQAQRDFVNAILRRESGAAIAPSEFDNASKQYFPQPGDTPAVIKQKADNRKIALQGVARAAGPSYQPPPSMGANGAVDYSTYFGGQ